jgi:phosphoribosylanthranilate isomerase
MKQKNTPQIKVCGLTRLDEALECVALGVDAIGCVFYPKSPRNLTEAQAKKICIAMPEGVKTIGVFVNETFSGIMAKVEKCRLKGVQLHGQESTDLVTRLRQENLLVIKALFDENKPSLNEAAHYPASAYLAECGKGKLPGGNAVTWNWNKAKPVGDTHPLILAGGLAPDNVAAAVAASTPDAVDVSSGVESSPGRKNLIKVKSLIEAVSRCHFDKKLRLIF